MPRAKVNMMHAMIEGAPPDFYMKYFQSPEAPEKELGADPRETLQRIYFHNCGANPAGPSGMGVDASGHLLPTLDIHWR